MKTIAFAALALAAGAGHAQTDPADPKAKAPPVQYRSAFSEYKPFRDPETRKWREANDEARRLGGHKGHVPKEKK